MKRFIKTLIREYFDELDGLDDFRDLDGFDDMDYLDDFVKPKKNKTNQKEVKIKKELESLPMVVRLYRLLIADNIDDINLETPGFHYSMDKNNLLNTHSFLKDKNYFLLTVDAPKSIIDIPQTVSNNINFPNEKEITLKNKGKGSKIISVEPING